MPEFPASIEVIDSHTEGEPTRLVVGGWPALESGTMEARRDEIPERAQSALDLLSGDVVRFQGLVEDLLEISRFDAGAIRLHMEELLAAAACVCVREQSQAGARVGRARPRRVRRKWHKRGCARPEVTSIEHPNECLG